MPMVEVPELEIRFVDDDAKLREVNIESLALEGLAARPFAGAEEALADIDPDFAGIFISDIRMPRIDGLELLARVRAVDPEIPVILITGHADVPMALGALRDGAFDFLTKPFSADHLLSSARRALDGRRLVLENRRLREAAIVAEDSLPLIGETPVMRQLRQIILEVAQADFDVLIEGETGTGKELVALMLHRGGARRGKPFVAVNCGALPEAFAEGELFGTTDARGPRTGRIESANRGTLFLDEIDSMGLPVQVKLLRVLEEREVVSPGAEAPRSLDMRVIAAAKHDLGQAVLDGSFRDDLYYRLNVIRLRLPPLRERRADVPLLFAHFLAIAAQKLRRPPPPIDARTRAHLVEHDWPGNVRELRNFAHRCALGMADMPLTDPTVAAPPLPDRVAQFEATVIRDTLASVGGNIAEATELLGIPRKTLYDKLTRHGISLSEFRP
jgi:two-component system, NtrC family, C4-dicarboxylate transport response regulator DctD